MVRGTTAAATERSSEGDETERRWRHLNELLEIEARRIAHALHDEIGQVLTAAHLALREAARGVPVSAHECLRKVEEALQLVERDLRRISHELRPTILDDFGLIPALQSLMRGMGQRSGLALTVTGSTESRLPCLVETALYRIVMEALTNVIKHSGATAAWVDVRQEGECVHCSVRDNGRGFDVNALNKPDGSHGLGLLGMKERVESLAGCLHIDSASGHGTEIQITAPLGVADSEAVSYLPRTIYPIPTNRSFI